MYEALVVPYYCSFLNGTTLSYVSGCKIDTVFAGGGGDVTAALKEAVDPVGVLPCCGERREEKIEVGLVSAVSGEVCV